MSVRVLVVAPGVTAARATPDGGSGIDVLVVERHGDHRAVDGEHAGAHETAEVWVTRHHDHARRRGKLQGVKALDERIRHHLRVGRGAPHLNGLLGRRLGYQRRPRERCAQLGDGCLKRVPNARRVVVVRHHELTLGDSWLRLL